jgi:serine/threonine-protein kinase HipA
VPTTHILKPPTGEWDGHAENEHFSLRLARAAGLIVPNSTVQRFGDEVAIVIERYDRIRQGDRWSRIHQEDMCQALGLHPTRKYESDGGPNAAKIVELLRAQSSSPQQDVLSFVDSIIFNWLIAGTDAHAKNFGLLLGSNGTVRLAPFYDLASVLPYRTIPIEKAKLAMKIGGEYRLRNIGSRNWQKFAVELRLDGAELSKRIEDMAVSLSDHTTEIEKELESEGLSHVTIGRLAARVRIRAVSCRRLLS